MSYGQPCRSRTAGPGTRPGVHGGLDARIGPPAWYAEHDVDLRLGVPVTGIDVVAHQVRLDNGSRVGYAKLLLTTGSTPRRLPATGPGAGGVRLADGTFISADAVIAGVVLDADSAGVMPPRRSGEPPWSPESVQLFRDWIAAGYQS